ncbi:MAG: hypothetical protein H6668_17045 [Ardenticatenaceae bacterium]|nr:hypothetical protein [Ardenticatenaceae bacterium]
MVYQPNLPIISEFRLFRRRRNGFSPVLLIFGILGIFMACGMTMCAVPASFMEGREVAGLDQPSGDELDALTPGTRALFAAQLSPEAAAGEQGLVLFYVEERPLKQTTDVDGNPMETVGDSWNRVTEPAGEMEMRADNGRLLTIQIPPGTTFMEAQRYDEGDPGKETRRTTGYLPGQAVTVDGTWQGNGIITATKLFGGNPEGYVTAVRAAPGQMLIFGLICGGLSVLLLGAGVVLRFLGR